MDNLVFDSYALIAFFDDEHSAGKVEQLLKESERDQIHLLISAINAGEIWYSYAKTSSEAFADDVVNKIETIGLEHLTYTSRHLVLFN